jgi:hypothetical protein
MTIFDGKSYFELTEEERKILHRQPERFSYDGNPYDNLSEQEWVICQRVEQTIGSWNEDLPFGEMLDYARHHNFPQEVIDTLEDFNNKVAWLVIQGTEVAEEAFIESIKARAEGDDRFCLWCNQREERKTREFFRFMKKMNRWRNWPNPRTPEGKE